MSAGGGQDGSSVSDEEWERFLRESAAGVPDAPEEPSARAREVTRRLREEPVRPQAWRSYEPAAPRRFKGWHAAVLVAASALLAVALVPGLADRATGWFGGADGTTDAVGAQAPESQRPTGPPAEQTPLRPTLAEPFRGSPAAQWANGAAGITVPPARATGWMNTAQVAQALARTRDFLAASNLDPGVLRGERPDRAVALINPHQKDVQDYLSTAFTTSRVSDAKKDPLLLFSRFDPSRTRLVGDVIKTRGRLAFQEGEHGALQVTADVTFVYPVVRAAAGSEEVARTIVRRETVLSWDDPEKVKTEAGTFSLDSYTVHMTNAGCRDTSGRLAPTFGVERSGAGTGPEVDPYDRSTPMTERMKDADGAGCGTATRT
ncbi:hypothetical protein ACQPZG_02520 (plasmid) [Streptomyces sp. CA-294286]|uniref:hypothetical protein n=1 Tax=Streptomyces sp. CA-294286 TaxID=3240070 RepID=UPI003D9372EF